MSFAAPQGMDAEERPGPGLASGFHGTSHHSVTKHTMRDFLGLEDANAEAKKAMMDFSYLSAIGNMDEAFKAIKTIKRFVPAARPAPRFCRAALCAI